MSKTFGHTSRDLTTDLNADVQRKETANFGSNEDMFIKSCSFKNKDLSKDILMTTFAGKKAKLFFYTQRELLVLKDGTFAYKRKNKSD